MKAKTYTIPFANVKSMRDSDYGWQTIADKLRVNGPSGATAVQRCYESGADYDYVTRPGGQKKKAKKRKAAPARKVGEPLRLQTQIGALVKTLRERGVSRLDINVERGEATITESNSRTVRVGGSK